MEKLIKLLRRDYPHLVFSPGAIHCWSPGAGQIFYMAGNDTAELASVLHELGHAQRGHQTYGSDLELLQKEIEAWEEAMHLAERYGIAITHEHIQGCLDSYRDWLHKRSLCPTCGSSGVQDTVRHYVCLNCRSGWHVSAARFCRPYRTSDAKQKIGR